MCRNRNQEMRKKNSDRKNNKRFQKRGKNERKSTDQLIEIS